MSQSRNLLILVILAVSSSAQAKTENQLKGIDLIIGGADMRPLASYDRSIGFNLGYDLESVVNCGSSDFEDIVKASFSTGQFKQVQSQLVGMLYQSIDLGSMVGTVLRKMYPDDYDSMMSGIVNANLKWGEALQECGAAQEMLWDSTVGGDTAKQAKAHAWSSFSAKADAGSLNFAEDWIKVVSTQNGVNIGGQYKGGDNQLPIRIPEDVTSQSFNKFSTGVTNSAIGIDYHFSSENDLNTFIKSIVGSKEIRVCEACEPVKSEAGTGIKPLLQDERKRVKTALTEISNKPQSEFIKLTSTDFRNISHNSKVPVDAYLIQSLNQLDPYRKNAYLESWSDEIAIANLMEKTLVARRVLQTGLSEGSIARSEGIISNAKELIAGIDYELDELERELRMSRLLTNSTSRAILMQRDANESSGVDKSMGLIQ